MRLLAHVSGMCGNDASRLLLARTSLAVVPTTPPSHHQCRKGQQANEIGGTPKDIGDTATATLQCTSTGTFVAGHSSSTHGDFIC